MERQVAPDDFGKAVPPIASGKVTIFLYMKCEAENDM